jgi:membrane protein DedA with SNARE-associated domain
MKTLIITFITTFILWIAVIYSIGWFVGQNSDWPISSEYNRTTTVMFILLGLMAGWISILVRADVKKTINKLIENGK